jgi:hypothetical protein
MYGLKPDEDLSFLIGVEVIQVCIGVNEVILNGDRDVRITILSDFSVSRQGGAMARFDDPREGASALVELLNESIASAEATAAGDLRLVFASGAELVAFDTNKQYESFWIKGSGREIIV